MADTDIVQVIAEARADAKSLSEFVFKPASFMVTRRLAPTINTLQYYVDNFERIKRDADIALADIPDLVNEAIANQGYVVAFSFSDGGVINERNEVAIDVNGNLYKWGGVLPKTVPAGSTPDSSGGFAKNAWVVVSDITVNQAVADLKNKVGLGTSNYHYTQMGKAFDSKEGAGDPFASWTHANIAYDNTTNKFVIFYNTNSGHDISRNSVLVRTKEAESNVFSAAVVVASDKNNFSYKTQASGIAANGDYLSLVARFPWGSSTSNASFVYRSTDKGVTWTRSEMLYAGAPLTAYNGDVSGFLVTKTGRILTFANHVTTRLCRIFYSDDHGVTWNLSSIVGNPYEVTEPAWCDLGDGKLVCIARSTIIGSASSTKTPAKFMTSSDNGSTWTNPVDSKSITNLSSSNGTLLPDYEKKTVEFIHHSRFTSADNFSSILRSWATFDEAFSDDFKPQVRIGKIAAYINIDDSTGDSGYVGAAKASNGVINAFYYTGKRTSAQINYMIGTPNTKLNDVPQIDYVTGSPSQASSFIPPVKLLIGGAVNALAASPIIPAPSGNTTGSSAKVTNRGLLLEQIASSDGSSKPVTASLLTPINLDNVDSIYVNIASITAPITASGNTLASLDFAISVHTGKNPTSTRAAVAIVSTAGYHKLDTSNLSGNYYLALKLTSRHPSASSALVDCIDVYDKAKATPFSLPSTYDYFWRNGFGYNGLKGLNVKPFGSGNQSVVTTDSFLNINAATTASNAMTVKVLFKDPVPVTAKYIEFKMAYNTVLKSGDYFEFGLSSILDPVNHYDGGIISKQSPLINGSVLLDVSDIVIAPLSYFYIKLALTVGNAPEDIKLNLNDIVVYY